MMFLSMDLGKFNTVCCFYDTRIRKHRFETITKRSLRQYRLTTNNRPPVREVESSSWMITEMPLIEATRIVFANSPRQSDLDSTHSGVNRLRRQHHGKIMSCRA